MGDAARLSLSQSIANFRRSIFVTCAVSEIQRASPKLECAPPDGLGDRDDLPIESLDRCSPSIGREVAPFDIEMDGGVVRKIPEGFRGERRSEGDVLLSFFEGSV